MPLVGGVSIALAAGVAFATILTLVLIPSLLAILNDFRLLLHRLRHGQWPRRLDILERPVATVDEVGVLDRVVRHVEVVVAVVVHIGDGDLGPGHEDIEGIEERSLAVGDDDLLQIAMTGKLPA